MRVAVLDHGMGNLRSVSKALEAAGADVIVSAERDEVEAADGLCVPGQGIFGRCMTNLTSTSMHELIGEWIAGERPYLGICLGMQVLFESSEEDEDQPGLGIVAGKVSRLPDTVRVPHMGWNQVGDEYFYFDHSYAAYASDEAVVTGWCEHGDRFAAEIRQGSILGVQFHPEKSAAAGLSLLADWIRAA